MLGLPRSLRPRPSLLQLLSKKDPSAASNTASPAYEPSVAEEDHPLPHSLPPSPVPSLSESQNSATHSTELSEDTARMAPVRLLPMSLLNVCANRGSKRDSKRVEEDGQEQYGECSAWMQVVFRLAAAEPKLMRPMQARFSPCQGS